MPRTIIWHEKKMSWGGVFLSELVHNIEKKNPQGSALFSPTVAWSALWVFFAGSRFRVERTSYMSGSSTIIPVRGSLNEEKGRRMGTLHVVSRVPSPPRPTRASLSSSRHQPWLAPCAGGFDSFVRLRSDPAVAFYSTVSQFDEGYARIKHKISAFLANIEGGMNKDSYKIPSSEYIQIYNVVFDMSIQRDPYNWSAQLYEKYCAEITAHVKSAAGPALEKARLQNPLAFLTEWPTRFEKHRLVEKGLSGMFVYLDRYYTPANVETCPGLVLRAWQLYKEFCFDPFKGAAQTHILSLIQQEREMVPQDSQLLKKAIDVYVELGTKVSKENHIGLYKADLSVPLVTATKEYYKGKAALWLAQDSCPDYLIKAEKAVLAEEHRLTTYLHTASTSEPLLHEVPCPLLLGTGRT